MRLRSRVVMPPSANAQCRAIAGHWAFAEGEKKITQKITTNKQSGATPTSMHPAYLSSYEYTKPRAPKPERDGASAWRRWLLWVAGGIAGLALMLLLVGWLFSPEISKKALAAVTNELTTKCTVKSVDLSLLRSFPHASVIMEQVYIEDTHGKPLLAASEVNLDFDFLSLWSDHAVIKRITLRRGVLNLRTDVRGRQNWDILRQGDKPKKNTAFSLDIRNARLMDIDMHLADERNTPWHLHAALRDARFLGRFSDTRFVLETSGRSTIHKLDYAQRSWLTHSPFDWQTTMLVDLQKNAWAIREGQYTLAKQNTLALEGMAVFGAAHSDFDLRFQAKKGDISLLLHLLPDNLGSSLRGLRSTGSYHCSGTVRGRKSKTTVPEVMLKFGMQGASIAHAALPKPLSQVQFAAELRLKPNGDGYLQVPEFRAVCDGTPVSASFRLRDFRNPYLDMVAQGRLRMARSHKLNEDWAIQQGVFDITRLELHGAVSKMKYIGKNTDVQIAGQANLSDVVLYYHGADLQIPQAAVTLRGTDAQISGAKVHLGKSDFAIEGAITGLLPFVLGEAKAPAIHANLVSQHVALDQLLDIVNHPVPSVSGRNSAPSGLSAPITGELQVQIANLHHGKVQAEQVQGKVRLSEKHVQFKAAAQAMQGKIAVAGKAYLDKRTRLDLNVGLASVHLPTLFAQTENFGQDFITEQNLDGTMTARIAVTTWFDEYGNHLNKSLVAYSDLLAHKGMLKGVKTLEDFSDYIHISDLRNVRFTTLQNYVEVRDGKVILPAMDIRNNACNLTISGEQSFDDEIHWFIKVNAGQALLNRLRKNEPDGEIMTGSNGWFNLYYTMQGTLDKYTITRNRSAVKKAFELSEKKKDEIAVAVERAFAANPPAFDMITPLRQIPDDEQIVGLPVSDSPQTEVPSQDQEPSPEPKPQRKPATSRHTQMLPPASVISQSSDDEFLDEIVGGGEK